LGDRVILSQAGIYFVANGSDVLNGTPLRVSCSAAGALVTGDGRLSVNPGATCAAIVAAFGVQDTFFNGSTRVCMLLCLL
jgi:hypothetical protein